MNEHERVINCWIEVAVNCWYKDQCRDPFERYYAFFKPAQGERPGAIVIATDPLNDDFHLISSQRVSPEKTPEQIKSWLMDLSRFLPILPA